MTLTFAQILVNGKEGFVSVAENWTREHLAYAAAIIDSDGSVGFASMQRKSGPYRLLKISAAMKDEGPIEFMHWLFGGGITLQKSSWNGIQKEPLRRWDLQRKADIYATLVALYQFMKNERKKAVVLEMLKAFRNNKLGTQSHTIDEHMVEEVI